MWVAPEPQIPEFTPSPKGGRRRTVDDRAALNGILYVLQTGIPWEDRPQKLGFGSVMTCWRRLRDWQAAGVWHRLHLALLRRLREHGRSIGSAPAWMEPASPAPGGPGNRPQPDRSRQARLETTHRRRCTRHSSGRHDHGSQSTRLDGVRCHSCRAGPEW
ncbi:conserved hypothetical protein [Burkholderia gladioli]|nr:conserved hypothetical protein [Burkholderia gladioli]